MNTLVPPEIEPQIERGMHSSTLAFALRCLPRERRGDMRAYYRFCRLLDDISDSEILPLGRKRELLSAWDKSLGTRVGLPEDLESLIEKYGLETSLLREIVAGVSMDLEPVRYQRFSGLRAYCRRVASAVGIACLPIFGAGRESCKTFAEQLGIALQLTNILRDIREDGDRGRIYLPAEDLARFRVDDLLAAEGAPEFRALLAFEAGRARAYFRAAEAALPRSERRALLAPRIMMRFYSSLLDRMELDGFRVLSRRYRLSRFEKIALALREIVRG